jgi:hypothetical protein
MVLMMMPNTIPTYLMCSFTLDFGFGLWTRKIRGRGGRRMLDRRL